MIAADQLYNIAKPDGLTLAMISIRTLFDQLLGAEGGPVRLGQVRLDRFTCAQFRILRCAPTRLSERRRYQKARSAAACGTTGTGATGHDFPKVLEEALGAKFQVILGYPGNREVEIAIERGEVHAMRLPKKPFCESRGHSWLKQGFVRALVQGGRKRDTLFPERRPL